MCGDKRLAVANKSEYIREGYALREKEQSIECVAKFIKRIRRSLKNVQLSIVCVSYASQER